jgi:hypothetical protein
LPARSRREAPSRPQLTYFSSTFKPSKFVFTASGESKFSFTAELSQLIPYYSLFQEVLICKSFTGDAATDLQALPIQLEQMLLEPEVGLFESLIGSVLGVDNSTGGVCALSKASTSNLFTFTIDSGSTGHVLTLEAAQQLLHWKERSHLQIVGVSGSSSRADVCGHLLICVRDPHSGVQYLIGPWHCPRYEGLSSQYFIRRFVDESWRGNSLRRRGVLFQTFSRST